MEDAGKRPVDIANELGISDAAVHHWFKHDTGPRRGRVGQLAAFLGVSHDHLETGASASNADVNSPRPHGAPLDPLIVWDSDELSRGRAGAWMLKRAEKAWIPRPERMRDSMRGFAFEVIDDKNGDVYRRRDTVLVNPDRRCHPGDDCLLTNYQRAYGPGSPAVVGKLVRRDGESWVILQYATEGEQRFPRKEFPDACYIQGVLRP